MLKFIIKGQTIKRVDTHKLVQYAQEYPTAEFEFDEDWNGLDKAVQWNMADETYDTPIEDGTSVVPWELLRNRGTLNVNVVGITENKVITTNTVSIDVMGCGIVGGMVSGTPSESYYKNLDEKIQKNGDDIDILKQHLVNSEENLSGFKDNMNSEIGNLNEKLGNEETARNDADNGLRQEIANVKEDLSDFKDYASSEIGSLDEKLGDEETARENVDNELKEQINTKQDKPTIVSATETTATILPNATYEYGEVSSLDLTLSDEVGSYEVIFESGNTATVLSLTSSKNLLWHNEPVVLPDKVYTLSIEVGTTYARAVLSYAESV